MSGSSQDNTRENSQPDLGESGFQGPEGYGQDPYAGHPALGPTNEEANAWAEQEHRRRQAWLAGPSEEEKHEWRRQERQRRLARLGQAAESEFRGSPPYGSARDSRMLSRRYARDAQLATEGLGLLLATLPFRMLAELVSAGHEWEEDSPQGQRRRVPLYDDEYR